MFGIKKHLGTVNIEESSRLIDYSKLKHVGVLLGPKIGYILKGKPHFIST